MSVFRAETLDISCIHPSSGNQFTSIFSGLSATMFMGNIFKRRKMPDIAVTSREIWNDAAESMRVIVQGYVSNFLFFVRLKRGCCTQECSTWNVAAFLEKHNMAISKWHFLTLLNCWNMQESMLLHNVAAHPRMRDYMKNVSCWLLRWCIWSFPAKRGVPYPNPKIKLLPSHADNTNTVPGCWRLTILNVVNNKLDCAARILQLVV